MNPEPGRSSPAGRWLAVLGLTLIVGLAALSARPRPVATPAKPAPSAADSVGTAPTGPHRVIAYYFHTTQRCSSCVKLEAFSREAIEAAFPADLSSGRLVWRVVNVEEPGNEHFVKEYQLYTKSLVLVDEVQGKPARWTNLEKIWQLLQDKPGFLRYVQGETRAYLNVRS